MATGILSNNSWEKLNDRNISAELGADWSLQKISLGIILEEITMDAEISVKKDELVRMLSEYCEKKIDDEYKELCIRMVEKMSRKKLVPFLSGKIEIWASAIVYALGQINFLFDKSFSPYQSADDICAYFGTSKSTTSQKAKIIREMFSLGYYDEEFSTKMISNSNPLNNYMMLNGFIVPKGKQ